MLNSQNYYQIKYVNPQLILLSFETRPQQHKRDVVQACQCIGYHKVPEINLILIYYQFICLKTIFSLSDKGELLYL